MADALPPTPDRVVDFRFAPPESWTLICRPADRHKTLVTENGVLLYDYDPVVREDADGFPVDRFRRVIRFGLSTGDRPLAISQSTESARVPIVRTILTFGRCSLELTTLAHEDPAGRRFDVVSWSIRAAGGVEPFLAAFRLEIQEAGLRIAGLANEPTDRLVAARPDGSASNRAIAVVASGPRLQVGPSFDLGPALAYRSEFDLVTADAPLRGVLVLPLDSDVADDADPPPFADLDDAWVDGAFEAERRFWNELDLQHLPLTVPDPGIMDMLTASARTILQNGVVDDGLPEFQVGPAIYRDYVILDGHFMLEALQWLGHAEEAELATRALLRRARPDGSIDLLPNHLKETAVALATIVRQAELGGQPIPPERQELVRRGLDWLDALHRTDEGGRVLPSAFADGGLGGVRAEWTTTLWILAGLNFVARGTALAPDLAARARGLFDELLELLRARPLAGEFSLDDGTPTFPMYESSEGLHHMRPAYAAEVPPWRRLNPGSATYALAHAIVPGDVFAAEDPIVTNFCRLLEQVDDEEGIPANTGWLPYNAVWTYSASFYAHVWLYAGRPDKAVDYLYAYANHAAPTRVWREEQSFRRSGEHLRVGDMPHGWASAEFIRLVRNLLVFERSNSIELLAGVPDAWLQPGDRIEIETPTRWGRIGVRVDAVGDLLRIEVEPDLHGAPPALLLDVPAAGPVDLDGVTVEMRGGRLTLPTSRRAVVTALRAAAASDHQTVADSGG